MNASTHDLIIKSQTKNRLRLKSKAFYGKRAKYFEDLIKKDVLSVRLNTACYSMIIYFDYKKIDAQSLINKFDSLNLMNAKQKITDLTPCNTCEICSTTDKKIPWKRRIFEFISLSAFGAYVLIREHFLGLMTPIYLVAVVSLFAAIPLLKDAKKDIKNKRFSLQTFMSFSLLLAIFGGEAMAAFEIIYILRGSMLFEEYTAEISKREIHKLVENDIKKVYILVNDLEIETNLQEVKNGDIVSVRSQEKIPVDGTIVDGQAEIDESLINGRSESIFKTKKDEVFANTLVQKGRIYIKTTGTGKDTYISRIISELEKSLAYKSKGVQSAEKLAAKVLKLGTILTLATYGLTGSLARAFSVMIVMSCPCSTVLAASSAVSAGIARGAKEGILIKGGIYLEDICQSEAICFDKTGTLTTSKPIITDIVPSKNSNEEVILKYALLAENTNSHPIANAINEYTKDLKPKIKLESEYLIGLGVKATYYKKEILVGNLKLLKSNKISTKELDKKASELFNEGKTVVFVSYNKKLLGLIALRHEVRKYTKECLIDLKKRGVKHLVLISGDEQRVADNFAKDYGFDEVYANLMPEDKAKIVEKLAKKYKKIIMIGDGVNDTLALSKSNVGISFASGGSEAAIEVSNIAITNSNPRDIVKLYDLSKSTLKTIEQNYLIGISTNILGVSLAALGMLPPILAGGVHIAHTGGIIANSSLINFKKISKNDINS